MAAAQTFNERWRIKEDNLQIDFSLIKISG